MGLKLKTVPFLLIYLCLIISSCVASKEDYLYRYERFLSNIQENYASFSERDWIKADGRVNQFNNILTKRYKLTQEEKKRVSNTMIVYNSYRSGNKLVDNRIEDPQRITENRDINIDRIEELKRITEHQEQISLQLEQLRRQILEDRRTQDTSQQITQQQRTEQELLIDKLQNDLLMGILASKKEGRRDISGRIKVLVLPTNFKGNAFRMSNNALTPTIQDAINIILAQARKYNQNITIDWEYRVYPDGSYVSINNYSEGLRNHSQYRSIYNNYDHLVLIYAVDMVERSYCAIGGSLGKSESNAIMWFKDYNGHSAGVLTHEIFHAFGAEDLYYEQGVVPQEVELNFKTLLGNSIMITSHGSSDLDPINAWLMGWNKKPEPWYAWFIGRRDNTVDVGLNMMKY
jgi:hypothetical protein